MEEMALSRRKFVKASIVFPFIVSGIVQPAFASPSRPGTTFSVTDDIHRILLDIYGEQANHIETTDLLKIDVKKIAENSAVVPVSLLGEKGVVKSVTMFVPENREPLVQHIQLSPYVDLPLKTRIRSRQIRGRSDREIIVVVQTDYGLLGVSQSFKVYMGGDSCS